MNSESKGYIDTLNLLLGHAARQKGLITHEQMLEALAEQVKDLQQGRQPIRALGMIFVSKGFLTNVQLIRLLEEVRTQIQDRSSILEDNLLGRILIESREVTEDQIAECLNLQAEAWKDDTILLPRLGELLVQKGYVSSETVGEALAQQAAKSVAPGVSEDGETRETDSESNNGNEAGNGSKDG